jgi:hypothetical protein
MYNRGIGICSSPCDYDTKPCEELAAAPKLQRLVGSEAKSPDLIQLRSFFLSVKYLVGMATEDKAERALVKHRS